MIASRRRYDLILIDGFDADARAGRLDTLPFYLDCRSRLADGGILSVNLLSRRKDFRRSVDRLRTAFDDNALAMPSCDSGNAIALAAPPPEPSRAVPPAPSFDDLREAAQDLRAISRLNLLPTLSRLSMFGAFPGGRLALAI
jgi:spermidine synthase